MKPQIISFLLALFVLPLLLIKDVVKSVRSVLKKILFAILILIVFGNITWQTYQNLYSLIRQSSFDNGLSDTLEKVPIRGSSMLPGIKDGDFVELKNPNKYGLSRGDIVTFQNNQTGGASYIKRIVGLGGETVVIKNGNVFINGKAISEDYTLNSLPTFGNTYITDCESHLIPDNQFMVLGDNRTVSSDSRVLGFISKDDISGVIKNNKQESFLDSEKQFNLENKKVDPEIFLELLNKKRSENSASALTTHQTLNAIGQKRAQQITENFNEWKTQTIPVDQLLDQTQYRTNQVHEYVTFGYLNEQAIIDQIFDSEKQANQFLSNEFTEVGIGITEKTNGECKFPVISIILSWPAIPTYDQKIIDSWSREIQISKDNLATLQSWVGSGQVDETKLKLEISKVAQMHQIATRIYNKRTNKEWLTQQDYQDIQQYDKLITEVNTLDQEIFGKLNNVQGITFEPVIKRRL